ncbi:hypothetical protein C8R44DRAFT_754681 [Mycena epipterygia]|nr:hypothetical protein C8R44DRAFT_754681 [Mycena epipterygia]
MALLVGYNMDMDMIHQIVYHIPIWPALEAPQYVVTSMHGNSTSRQGPGKTKSRNPEILISNGLPLRWEWEEGVGNLWLEALLPRSTPLNFPKNTNYDYPIMSSDRITITEPHSVGGVATQPAPGASGPGPTSTPLPVSDVAEISGPAPPSMDHATPPASPLWLTAFLDEDGQTFLGDQHGNRFALRRESPQRSDDGTLSARLMASTAAVAEHQAATEDMHDNIHAVRTEVVSRIDSLRNEVNSHRARLNRCLDDNLRVIQDSGMSGAQVQEILTTMSCNGGAHRQDRAAPTVIDTPLSAPRAPLPNVVRTTMNAMVPPRTSNETQDEFDKHANTVLCTKEQAHAAFPLPAQAGAGNPAEPVTKNLQSIYTKAMYIAPPTDENIPVPLNNSASASASGTGAGNRDALADFAQEAATKIRSAITAKVGVRIELLSSLWAPKVANPTRYKGQDDHDFFMMEFLEKLLGWMQAGTIGGKDLNHYRVVLMQNYLDTDAHRWCVNEVKEYSSENEGRTPLFADLVCAMHHRGAQMAQVPSDFVYKERFIVLLPQLVTKELRMRRGFTVEFTALETLRTHARQVWEVERGLQEEAEAAAATATHSEKNIGERTPDARNPAEKSRDEKIAIPAPRTRLRGLLATTTPKGVSIAEKCPNYSSHPKARVAVQHVIESYSDEDTQSGSEDSRSSQYDEEYDSNEAPDLDTHLESRESTSIPLPMFGSYNEGPLCIVCHDCALVVRTVAATPENGLPSDQEYRVCEHLANIGLDPNRAQAPASPKNKIIALPPTDEEEGITVPTALSEFWATAEFPNGYGPPLNRMGDPDFEIGTIVDITQPADVRACSVKHEIRLHEEQRARTGLRPLTALEYYANEQWLGRFRDYTWETEDNDRTEFHQRNHEELMEHPVFGCITRTREMLYEMISIREEEAVLKRYSPATTYTLEPAQTSVMAQLGDMARVH